MNRRRLRASVLMGVLALVLAGCAAPEKTAKAPSEKPAALHLLRTGFSALPGYAPSSAALDAFRRGCAVLAKRSDDAVMGGAGYAGRAGDWRGVCAAAQEAPADTDFFATHFVPYAISTQADGGPQDQGLFTGYYEPEISGSRTRQGRFQIPVYGLPADLVRVDLGAFLPRLKGEQIWGRVQGHALTPYPDRAAIQANGIANAPVLFYTDDAAALFFLQIQGSGRVVFDDGGTARVAYAGQNGQPYTAIGRALIADGSLARADVSLQSIRAWLAAHPERARAVMESNQSYVFFRLAPLGDVSLGSAGALGVPLTPMASLAIDPRRNALGAPFFVAVDGADPLHGVMIAQDTGGAIRGAVRGDIFFGFGPQAEARAGAMKGTGRLFVLLPRALAARIGDSAVFGGGP